MSLFHRSMKLAASIAPPAGWEEACLSRGRLFQAPKWQQLLANGFGSRTVYAWDSSMADGMAITVFHAGPFRIAYVGFPVGGTLSGCASSPSQLAALMQLQAPIRLDLLRVPVSAFSDSAAMDLQCGEAPETAILRLQEWDVRHSKKLHRDVKKARHSDLQVKPAFAPSHGDQLYRLYRDTVARHGGALRYNAAYFRALVELSISQPGVRCLLAAAGGVIGGFVVVVKDGTTAYYLHGATVPAMKHLGVTDLLLLEGIEWARSQGAEVFNLMSSPPGQSSLIRYKEKWGGVTGTNRTYELVIRRLPTRLFRAAVWLQQHLLRR